ncbi:MAG: glutaredoxin [Planctomycetota bacterium]|jgi:glutaredoxin
MKIFFRAIRWLLGQIIIFIDWISRPSLPSFPPEVQRERDNATASMKLYQFKLCPFCVKTRRTIRRLGLNIETRDARNNPKWNQELITEGGRYQVPCLRLSSEAADDQWLYESEAINLYLEQRFAPQTP